MKIFIGGAIGRNGEPGYWRSLAPLFAARDVVVRPHFNDALIERARAINATYFLRETDCDVHLSIDGDIEGFTPKDVLEVCQQAETHDIVSGVYVTRGRKMEGLPERCFPASFFEDGVRVEMAHDATPVPCQWAATGFMAVHRRVFEELAKGLTLYHPNEAWAFYRFYEPMPGEDDDGNPILLSEDYALCERARAAGFGVYLNPRIRLGHIGPYSYRLEDMATTFPPAQPLAVTRTGRNWRVESIEARSPVGAQS